MQNLKQLSGNPKLRVSLSNKQIEKSAGIINEKDAQNQQEKMRIMQEKGQWKQPAADISHDYIMKQLFVNVPLDKYNSKVRRYLFIKNMKINSIFRTIFIMGKLVIHGNKVYTVDEACMRKKNLTMEQICSLESGGFRQPDADNDKNSQRNSKNNNSR